MFNLFNNADSCNVWAIGLLLLQLLRCFVHRRLYWGKILTYVLFRSWSNTH